MRTSLYKGSVHHVRRRPKRHSLYYRVFSLLIDLDEFQLITASSRLLRVNKPGLFSFWERDHGNGTEYGLKAWACDHLLQAGFEPDDFSVRLLCYPRILGYVFNPLSVYYCYDKNDVLIATLHEVNNTFGEKHTYVLPASGDQNGGEFQQSSSKNLAVSPFTQMDGTYKFKMNVPGENIHVHITLQDDDGPVLSASFVGTQHKLNDRALFSTFFQFPLMTIKIMAGIHLEAMRIWLKGVPLVARNPATEPISASHKLETKPHPSTD